MRAPFTARSPDTAASLMPIYAALLTLTGVGLVGLALAFWPPEYESTGSRTGGEEAVASPRRAVDEGSREPREVRVPRTRMRSM